MTNTIAFFNDLAHKWDTICVHNPKKIHTLLEIVDIKKEATILDVGCGTGILESFLLNYEPKEIVAVDVADKMIEKAKEKYNDPRISFKCMDVMAITQGHYDYMIIYSAFPHFKDVEGLLLKAHNLLKTGGKLVICHSEGRACINGHHEKKAEKVSQGLPKGEVLGQLISRYFEVETIIDNGSYYMIVGVK